MRWDDRQRALLDAIGIKLWWPERDEADAGARQAGDAPPAVGRRPAAAAAAAASVPLAARAADTEEAGATLPPETPPAASRASAVSAAVTLRQGDDARAAEIASMDWPALREAVAGCRACGLCAGRRNTVFGVGHEQARWMIVGEAPGEQEDLKGEPFVGPAGQLLDNMLHSIGLTRAPADRDHQVFIANTLKCRPPRNRNPEPDETLRCRPFLLRQLALVQPRVIVAMGRFASQSLLGTEEAIGRLRGRVHRFAGIPLIVTYHPAYLLRQLPDKARAWEDLCLAASVAEQAAAV